MRFLSLYGGSAAALEATVVAAGGASGQKGQESACAVPQPPHVLKSTSYSRVTKRGPGALEGWLDVFLGHIWGKDPKLTPGQPPRLLLAKICAPKQECDIEGNMGHSSFLQAPSLPTRRRKLRRAAWRARVLTQM
jgi:hypothetical protein